MVAPSKFAKISTTCVEYVHPWTNSCVDAHAWLLLDSIRESFRIYVTVYTLAMIMKGRIPRMSDIKKTVAGILQSTAFLSMCGFSYSYGLCAIRKIMGHYNFLTVSFIPSFISSIMSILIERPSRRSLLSLYVANVATETVWRMAVARNYVKPIKYGEVLIFGVSTAILMCHFRSGLHKDGERNDSMFDLLRFVVGPCEEKGFAEKRSNQRSFYKQQTQNVSNTDVSKSRLLKTRTGIANRNKNNMFNLINAVIREYKRLIHQIKCGSLHQSCPHPFSCIYYILSGGVKQFSVGLGLQLCLKLLLNLKRIIQRPKHLKIVLCNRNIISLGLFLGGYSVLFRLTSCIMRWITGKDSQYHALPAGLIASISFTQYPDNTVALYVMWKMLQRCYSMGVKRGFISDFPGFTVFLYALSTATLFHAAILEPTNLRPSYWKFLHTISGARVAAMARKPLDVFGLDTSKLLKETMKRTNTHIYAKHLVRP